MIDIIGPPPRYLCGKQTTRDQVPTVDDDDVEVRDVVEKVVATGEPAFFTADDGRGRSLHDRRLGRSSGGHRLKSGTDEYSLSLYLSLSLSSFYLSPILSLTSLSFYLLEESSAGGSVLRAADDLDATRFGFVSLFRSGRLKKGECVSQAITKLLPIDSYPHKLTGKVPCTTSNSGNSDEFAKKKNKESERDRESERKRERERERGEKQRTFLVLYDDLLASRVSDVHLGFVCNELKE